MEEKNRSMTDEALSQQLRRHRSGKLAGRLLSLVGVVIAVAGMVLGGNIVPIILGGVILALGQTIQRKTREQAGQQTFRAIAPDVVSAVFENVQLDPAAHLLNAEDTNIPPQLLQRQRVHPRDISGTDYGAVHRQADGGGRVSARGKRTVGENRA